MGSYLSQPVTTKISSDESNDKLNCGASSMQGWRVSQEDAHNCILDYDTNTSFFSVYDGHGGPEVALYCSQEFPQFLKEIDAYKNKDFENALQNAFLKFDSTIATPKVVAKLIKIAAVKEAEEDTDEEENVNNLYEEAAMPIEQVIEKYTSNLLSPTINNILKDSDESKSEVSTSNVNKITDNCASTSDYSADVTSSSNISSEVNSSSNEKQDIETNEKNQEVIVTPDSTDDSKEVCTPSNIVNDNIPIEPKENGDVTSQNDECTKSENVTSSSPSTQENGESHISKKGKGKALMKSKGVKSPSVIRVRPKRNAQQLYKNILDFSEDSEESEDEEDKTFEGPSLDSSDDDTEGADLSVCDECSDESSEEDEEDEEDDDLDDEDEIAMKFGPKMKDEAGVDSGCTAVVALLHGQDLYVANAGDSRCIVCRNGKAIEMSKDHKPEDELEHDRVIKAGGFVTSDGRVDGGLNLSRAIGDHAYKQNKALSDREQMITALPDVKMLTINPNEDEFMVLACDGIWNFMSSQEVVDFVRPRIHDEHTKLSGICEEMFDHCLAPDTLGDGTGCDNMTAVIVQFKKKKKRAATPDTEENIRKKPKTDEDRSEIETCV